MEVENQDQNESQLQTSSTNPSKRTKVCAENSSERRMIPSRKSNIVVVLDRGNDLPTYASIEDYESATSNVGIDDKKYLVDNDDFVAMIEIMREWQVLFLRKSRLTTALHALKTFLQVDDESGSYKIISCKLTDLQIALFDDPHSWRRGPIFYLPTSIGKLTHLQELNLSYTNISEIPSEIELGCKHLRVLNLSETKKFQRLSDGIMHFSELEELYLQHSAVVSVPHYSIWLKLQKLKVLDLGATYNLQTMRTPKETFPIEDETLKSLYKLNLRHSRILKRSSSPSSPLPSSPPLWDSLVVPFFFSSKSLVDLDMGGFLLQTNLADNLADSLIRTSALERLDLSCTDCVTELPHTWSTAYDKLENIKVLLLKSTPLLRFYPQQQKASNASGQTDAPLGMVLKNHLRNLGCVGLRRYQTKSFAAHRRLRNLLGVNRARFHLNKEFGSYQRVPMALWPMLLSKGSLSTLFRPYEECKDGQCDCRKPPKEIDARFQLLVTFCNEIFVQGRRV